jgi:ABC-type multidrug transport system fused ATPase/permease subunit
MARCLENIQGKVTICGVNIFDIPLPAYRKLVQVFPQDAYILSGTVRDFLDPHAMFDDAKISTILKDLNSAIQNDPFQNVSLNMTVVGGGANLSAGQKQILALARASLAVEAKIVILDEITSNMDASVGKLAIQIVKDELLSRNIAVLLIAHVIQDILSCDNVIVMCAGEITERSRRSAQIVDDDLTKKTN